MDLRPEIQLQSMIKAMTEVVLPAVDPDNDLACEQAQLVIGMLHLMAARLPWQFHFDVDALRRALQLSSDICGGADGGPETRAALNALGEAAARGSSVLDGAKTAPEDLEEALLDLRARTSSALEALHIDGAPDCRKEVDRAVLNAAREQNVRDRAWFSPQGWDTEAEAPAPLSTLLNTHPKDLRKTRGQKGTEQ